MSVLDALFARYDHDNGTTTTKPYPPPEQPISWTITCWADWHGRWFARVEFGSPLSRKQAGSTELVDNAMTAAKRRIRRQVNASTAGLHVPALRYNVVGMEEQRGGKLAALTIAEQFE